MVAASAGGWETGYRQCRQIVDQLPDVRGTARVASEVPWAWSLDSRLLALATTDGLRLWDVERHAFRASLRTWPDAENACVALAFGPIGSPVAEALSDGATLWDTEASAQSGHFTAAFPVTAITRTRGDVLAVAGPGAIDVYPGAPSASPTELRGPHAVEPVALAFSPDATLLAAARVDGVVDVWDLAERSVRFSLDDGAEQPFALSFAPSGDVLAVGYRDGRGVKRTSPPGRWISGSVRLWSMKDGRSLATLRAIGGTDESYVMTGEPDARIEFFGASGRSYARCRAGALTLPFEACAERFEVDGLLEKSLAADRSYREP